MKEFRHVMAMLNQLNMEFKTFKSKKFIAEEAINAGAKYTVNVRGVLDICFDINGKVVGHYTDSANSFVKRNIK